MKKKAPQRAIVSERLTRDQVAKIRGVFQRQYPQEGASHAVELIAKWPNLVGAATARAERIMRRRKSFSVLAVGPVHKERTLNAVKKQQKNLLEAQRRVEKVLQFLKKNRWPTGDEAAVARYLFRVLSETVNQHRVLADTPALGKQRENQEVLTNRCFANEFRGFLDSRGLLTNTRRNGVFYQVLLIAFDTTKSIKGQTLARYLRPLPLERWEASRLGDWAKISRREVAT